MNASYSIITPVFNEEELLLSTVEQNLRLLRASGIDFEMVLVNDGSKDRSALIMDELQSCHPEVQSFHKVLNEGFGSAMSQGFRLAGKEWFLCLPVDCPLTEESLRTFVSSTGKADIIVAYRPERKGYSARMKVNSKVFHWLTCRLFGLELKDFNWLHMYRGDLFRNGTLRIRSKGLFMLAEVLVRADRAGLSFHEVTVDQPERLAGVATASKPSAVAFTLKEMLGFFLSLKMGGDRSSRT